MTDGTGRRFRPTLWATLAAALGLAVLLGLGAWQLQRLAWKNALIAELEARGSAPPIALPAAGEDPRDLEFRVVRLTGGFPPGEPLFRGPTSYKRKPGYHYLLPFQPVDGRPILVDLGFLPLKTGDWSRELPATWKEIAPSLPGPASTATIEGVLRRGGWQGSEFLRPANDPAKNVWHYVDLPAMADQAGLDGAETAFYVVALSASFPEDRLTRVRPGVDLRNDHLQYALTWFSLAAVLAVIYFLFHWRKPGVLP